MHMKRQASANWIGTGKEGSGTLSTQSKTLHDTPYSFTSRFESGKGTNPEELVAAAHAGCFSMKLSFNLSNAGFPPQSIDTSCDIALEQGTVTSSHLKVSARVPDIDDHTFHELVKDAELNCPISKLLNTKIICEAELIR